MFDRISRLLEQVSAEKQAGDGMTDPGTQDGSSSHVSAKVNDPTLRKPVEGEQSADDSSEAKKINPSIVDKKPEITPDSAPKQEEQQLGTGKPTGDPGVSTQDKPRDERDGDMGGTSHPAKGSLGDKCAQDITSLSNADLYKMAADLGNEIAADLATSQMQAKQASAAPAVDANQAAQAGYQASAQSSDEALLDKYAADVITSTTTQAQHAAELVYGHLRAEAALAKQAAEKKIGTTDPTGGESEGEDHTKSSDKERSALLDTMAGAAPAGGEGALGAGAGGDESFGGAAVPPPPGAEGAGGEAGGPPPELQGMNEEQALQELAMALMELGIDPAALAAAAAKGGAGGALGAAPPMPGAGPEAAPEIAAKMAAAVSDYRAKKSAEGTFRFTEAKQGSAQRTVRDYMKDYVSELYTRSRG
jgi:hypothetical protein